VNLKMEGDSVRDARIVLYGVAPIPWRSETAERAIRDKTVSVDSATAAAMAAAEGAKPLSMNGYKVPLVKTAVKRALLDAIGNRYWEEV
jgi:xanthine dehydrogenase YagS FAD-binding subunit